MDTAGHCDSVLVRGNRSKNTLETHGILVSSCKKQGPFFGKWDFCSRRCRELRVLRAVLAEGFRSAAQWARYTAVLPPHSSFFNVSSTVRRRFLEPNPHFNALAESNEITRNMRVFPQIFHCAFKRVLVFQMCLSSLRDGHHVGSTSTSFNCWLQNFVAEPSSSFFQ